LRRDAACGNGGTQNRAMLRMGRRLTRHPQLGAAKLLSVSVWILIECKRLTSRLELMSSRRGVVGRSVRKRVDPARVERRYGIRAADAVRAASGLCPASVRHPSGGCPSHEVLPLRQTPSLVRDGIRQRQSGRKDEMVLALLFLTMFDVDQHRARPGKGHDWDANGSAAREGLHLRPPRARPNRSW
jgi:hypothetical protein